MSRDSDGAVGLRLSFEAMLGKLSAGLDALSDTLAKIHRYLAANPVQTPVLRAFMGNYVAAASATTYGFLDLGGPAAGWRREVRWFCVWGVDPFTTITGNVVAFVAAPGQFQDSNTEPAAFPQLAAISGSIPNRFSAGPNEVTLVFPQRFLLGFKSLGNNVAVNAFGQAWDYKESTLVSEPIS